MRWPWQRRQRTGPRLRLGEEIKIDGRTYVITDASWSDGGTLITLQDKTSFELAHLRRYE